MKALISTLVVTSLTATPAFASVREAAFAEASNSRAAHTSVFVGATYRVGLDRRTADRRGRASLRFAGMHRTSHSEVRFGQGLEVTSGHNGEPQLFIAGRDLGRLESKAKLNGTTTAVIVGGVLLLGIVAAVAISDYERSQRCIGEEGDCD